MASTASGRPPFAILYEQDQWNWHELHSLRLQFRQDGSGELWWLVDHDWILVVFFDWHVSSVLETETSHRAITSENANATQHPNLVGKFGMTMQLKRQPVPGHEHWFHNLDVHYKASAYAPKEFTVIVEQGNFRSPYYAGLEENSDITQRRRWEYRLVFDKSPYPPPQDWAVPWHPRIAGTDPERTVEFISQRLPVAQNAMVAMNAAWQWEMHLAWEARPPKQNPLDPTGSKQAELLAERQRYREHQIRLQNEAEMQNKQP